MGGKVIVSAGQMGPSSYGRNGVEKEGNVNRIVCLIEEAIRRKSRLICFPELCLTDYFAVTATREYEQYFESVPNELTRRIFDLSRDNGIAVILPYAESDGVTYYNTAAFIESGKIVGKYRKVHIPSAFVSEEAGLGNFEKQYFTPGNLGFPVVEIGTVKAGVQICYDRHFPEGYRALAIQGAQVVFNPTALPYRGLEWRKRTWETFLRVRSFENQVFVVGVNKGGVENGLEFAGDSMIISPAGGEIIARAVSKGDELVTCEINLGDITEGKKILPIFRDRRPDQYKILIE
jgi:beta-ureidopropionase